MFKSLAISQVALPENTAQFAFRGKFIFAGVESNLNNS